MRNKIVSLKNNEDFKNVLKGHKLSNKYFVMFYKKLLKKNSNNLNISIVTQKKNFKNAVQRNFCKRRFKSIVNEVNKKISLNFKYSYLILTKESALKKDSFEDLKKTMFSEFNKIR
jgi:ribonuclease P protein component|tara:strand:+ start:25 stop:372 length:348 start_codon:yes stop_codon:yes gene_type:complete